MLFDNLRFLLWFRIPGLLLLVTRKVCRNFIALYNYLIPINAKNYLFTQPNWNGNKYWTWIECENLFNPYNSICAIIKYVQWGRILYKELILLHKLQISINKWSARHKPILNISEIKDFSQCKTKQYYSLNLGDTILLL